MLDAAQCEMHSTVILNHILHTWYVTDGVSVLLCYFARERIVEQMCRVQDPQSSVNKKKKRTQAARAEYHCELQANQYNQCSLSVVIFMCRQDASVSSFPQQHCHML